MKIINVNGWVRWLLGGYLIFWLSHHIIKSNCWKILASILVVIVSVMFYYLRTVKIINSTIWTTECYGFVWGIILASVLSEFVRYFKKSWMKKWIFSLIIALILGIGYLKLKSVFFFGDYLLKIILGVAITMFILIANVKYHIGNKISMFLGEISFEVYLIHGNVFYVISKIFPSLSSGIFILICLIVTVILAFIIHILATVIIKQLFKVSIFRNERNNI